MAIPKQTIEAIRDRVDIVEIVSQYVDLKRTGSRFVGLCPFHQEKTPSFSVSPDRQYYHCFGCSKGGSVFDFVMEMEGVSFPEAVRSLGKRVGIEVENRPGAAEDESRNDKFFEANRFAAMYYHQQLMDDNIGRVARDYMAQRGIEGEALKKFGLGYAPNSWDGLLRAAARAKIPRQVLSQLKLIVKRENANGYFDYFRNRVMFPIVSVAGRVQGFGARALGDAQPKYLNSAESVVFAKRRTFYGMNLARDAIREKRDVIVVEGYTDLISLSLAGFDHCVAACGTALTPDHARLLRRLSQNATMFSDGDSAGETASVAAGALLVTSGLEVRVVRLARGEDPDTVARDRGPDGVKELLDGAVDYFEFLNYAVNERGTSPREKEGLIRRVMAGVAQVNDPLRFDVVVNELAKVFGVTTDSLRRLARGGPTKASAQLQTETKQASRPKAVDQGRVRRERLVLRLILELTPAGIEAIDTLDADDFCDDKCRNLYNLLDSCRQSHIDLRSREFQRLAESSNLEGFTAEIALTALPPGNVDDLIRQTVRRIKEDKIRDELALLSEKLQTLPAASDEAIAVAQYYQELKRALTQL